MNILQTAIFTAIVSTLLVSAAPVASANAADLVVDRDCHAYDVACDYQVCHYSYTYGWTCGSRFCYVYTTRCELNQIV